MSQKIIEQQTGINRDRAAKIADHYRALGGYAISVIERNYFDCDLTIVLGVETALQGNYRRVN